MKFPIVFRQKPKKDRQKPYFFMTEETQNTIPDMTDMDEIRKAIIANEILNRKY